MSTPKRGDTFVWRGQVKPPVYIEVTRVAKDGTWADIRCCTWSAMWTKRQPLPLPGGTEPYHWFQSDLDRDAADWMRRAELTAPKDSED